jgi:hypothetical protein
MPNPKKISNSCLKDMLEEGFTQSQISRMCSISRQAISCRIHYKSKSNHIKLRRYTVVFLRKLGFRKIEISKLTNYTTSSVTRILRDNHVL